MISLLHFEPLFAYYIPGLNSNQFYLSSSSILKWSVTHHTHTHMDAHACTYTHPPNTHTHTHTHTQHQYTQVEPKAARNQFKMTDHTKVVYAQVDKKKLKLVDRNETPPRESSIGCLLQHSVWTNAVFLFFTVHLSL